MLLLRSAAAGALAAFLLLSPTPLRGAEAPPAPSGPAAGEERPEGDLGDEDLEDLFDFGDGDEPIIADPWEGFNRKM